MDLLWVFESLLSNLSAWIVARGISCCVHLKKAFEQCSLCHLDIVTLHFCTKFLHIDCSLVILHQVSIPCLQMPIKFLHPIFGCFVHLSDTLTTDPSIVLLVEELCTSARYYYAGETHYQPVWRNCCRGFSQQQGQGLCKDSLLGTTIVPQTQPWW